MFFEIIWCNCMGSCPECQDLHESYCGLVRVCGHWLVLGVREVREVPVDPSVQGFPVGLGGLRGKEDRSITAVTDTACHSIKMKRSPLKMITITDCGRCDERRINDDKSQRGDGSDKVLSDATEQCVCVCVGLSVCMCVCLCVGEEGGGDACVCVITRRRVLNGVVVGTYSEAWENSNKHHPPLQSVPGTGSQQITPSLHANCWAYTACGRRCPSSSSL